MRLFEVNENEFINPQLVVACRVCQVENWYVARFQFEDKYKLDLLYKKKQEAVSRINEFVVFCASL